MLQEVDDAETGTETIAQDATHAGRFLLHAVNGLLHQVEMILQRFLCRFFGTTSHCCKNLLLRLAHHLSF